MLCCISREHAYERVIHKRRLLLGVFGHRLVHLSVYCLMQQAFGSGLVYCLGSRAFSFSKGSECICKHVICCSRLRVQTNAR